MAKKKRIKDTLNANPLAENVHIEGAGNIKDEKIVDTLVTKAELSRAQILSAEQCNSTLTVTHLYMKQ